MKKVLNVAARFLARLTFTTAVAGAESASFAGIYQPKTPEALTKR